MTAYRVTYRVGGDLYRTEVHAVNAAQATTKALAQHMPCEGIARVEPLNGTPTRHVRYRTASGRVARVVAHILDPMEVRHGW